MPAPVFDAQTMQPVSPSPEELAAGFASGRYGFDANAGKVLLKDADGTIYHATPDKAAQYIASGKYTLPTADEELAHTVHKEEEAKGVVGSLTQGAESALNQATFGVEEAVARGGLSPEELKKRELRQEEHAVSRGVGGAVGIGTSLLYGGEVFKGADLAGQAAEHLLLPAERAAQAAFATKVAAKAANYATQGAALAAPQAIAQAAFGDPKQAAETLLWGIGAGGALGGGAELLGGAARAAAGAAKEALGGEGALAGALDKFANVQALRSAGGQKAQLKKLGEEGQNELGALMHEKGLLKPTREETAEAIVAHRKEVGEKMGDTINKLDDIFSESNGYKVGKTVEPEVPAAPQTERVKRTGAEVGEYLRDHPEAARELAATGKLPEAAEFHVPEPPPPKLAASFATASDPVLEKAIKPGDLGNAIRKEFDIPEMRMEMNSAAANAYQMIARDADRIASKVVDGQSIVGFKEANDFASDLLGNLKKAKGRVDQARATGVKVATPLDEAKANAYEVVRTFINNAADNVALASDKPELVRALSSVKNEYRQMKQLEEMAANYTAQAGNKPIFGLTDTIHAGQGMASGVTSSLGAGLGAAIAGPGGAVAGHAIGRVAGIPLDFMAKKWFENKGLIYLSTIAKKAAQDGPDVFSAVIGKESNMRLDATMKGIGETIRRMATTGIQATAARTQEHMAALLGSTSGLTHDQSYAKLENRLNTLASNPQALTQTAAALSSPFVTAAPEVAAQYQKKVADAVTYLHQALPKPPAPPAPFSPQTWSPSAQQKLAFHDKAEIVANPMKAMEHVAQGTLSDSHLEALQTMYPSTYARMQSEVLKFAGEHPDLKLPLAERASVSKFLGMPLDPITQPAVVQAMQSTYSAPTPKPTGGRGGGRPIAAGKLKKLPGEHTTFSSTMSGSVGEQS